MFSTLRTIISAIAALTLGWKAAHAQQAASSPPEPPYQISGTHHIMIGVIWDEATLKKLLPAGVKPVKDLTGAFNLYKASGGYGISPYTSAYAWADVEGFDSADGTKGRWMLAGVYGPSQATTIATRDIMGFPTRNGITEMEETTQGLRAVGSVNGQPVVIAEVKSSPLPCQPIAGTLNYPVQIKGQIMVNQIPYSGSGCGAEAVSLKIVAPAGDPFASLAPAKMTWAAEFRNGAFAFLRPVAKR